MIINFLIIIQEFMRVMEKLFLLDINRMMINCWNEAFAGCGDVYVVNEDFKTFISKNDEVDGIVSPGNSFGLMDGGYDKAISEYLVKLYMKLFKIKLWSAFGESSRWGHVYPCKYRIRKKYCCIFLL